MLKEFKAFAMRGNVIDLAVGVIIGGAFGKIVSSLVADIIMPVVGLLTGGQKFANMFLLLKDPPAGSTVTTIAQAAELNLPTLNYGIFITQIIDFLIIAFTIFIMVKLITKARTAAENIKNIGREAEIEAVPEPEPTTKECPFCKSTIHIEAVRCPNCTSQL